MDEIKEKNNILIDQLKKKSSNKFVLFISLLLTIIFIIALYFIGNKFIDNAFSKAIQSGAYGGRICGAGGGGFMLFFASPKYHKKLIKNMKKLGLKKFDLSFGNKGTEILVDL